MMYKHMIQFLDRPDLYQKTEAAFWDDEHISGEMLKAHLAPDFEGASRKLEFIQRSAAWIGEIARTIWPWNWRKPLMRL